RGRADRPRPGVAPVAQPAPAPGRAADRREDRDRWQHRRELPAFPRVRALLPRTVGGAKPAMSRNVLITGGSNGIGREAVRAFARAGDTVWFTYFPGQV